MANGFTAYGSAGTTGYTGYGGNYGSGEHSILRSGNVGKDPMLNIWELIFLPWGLLVLLLVVFGLAGANGDVAVLFVIPVILLALVGAFCYIRYRQRRNNEVILGLLCLTAVLAGICVGSYAVIKNLNEFYRLGRGASYYNVLTTETAASKIDATTLDFTSDTKVDTSRTYGYVDAHTGTAKMYCVAPVSSGNPLETRVQFFAAGLNCCGSRTDFRCGAATNIKAHGAVVLPKDQQHLAGYKSAVLGASRTYDLLAADSYILVEWKYQPVRYRDNLAQHTWVLFGIFAGVYLLLSTMVGCVLLPIMKQT